MNRYVCWEAASGRLLLLLLLFMLGYEIAKYQRAWLIFYHKDNIGIHVLF